MAGRMTKGVSVTASIVIVAAILVVLNLISENLFTRADLTEEGIYSLSEASIGLMKNLSDYVVVKCYFSEDLPYPYNQNSRYLKDKLADYRAYSGGKLDFEFIDPVKSGKEEEAQSYRIAPWRTDVYERDRLELKMVYTGIVFLHGDQTEVIPVVKSVAGIEYEITRAIKKITTNRTPRIAFVTGHGGPDLQSGLSNVNTLLSRDYAVQPLDLSAQTEIPSNIDAVIIMAPKEPFGEWEQFLLDQYLMKGGKVGIMLDEQECDIQQNSSEPIETGLEPLLVNYGLGLNDDLVIDERCGTIQVQQQSGFFRIQNAVPFRYFPTLTNLATDNVIVKGLEGAGVTLVFASSLDTTVAVPEGVSREIIAWSSEHSGVESEPFNFDPFRKFTVRDFSRQDIPLAAVLQGRFPSYFAGRDIPEYTGTDSTFTSDSLTVADTSANTRIIVIGDGGFVDDRSIMSRGNLLFFLNIVDWLCQDEGLISIRSKQVAMRPLDDVSDSTKRITKWVNILAMPILVIVVGVIRWRMRVASKKRRF